MAKETGIFSKGPIAVDGTRLPGGRIATSTHELTKAIIDAHAIYADMVWEIVVQAYEKGMVEAGKEFNPRDLSRETKQWPMEGVALQDDIIRAQTLLLTPEQYASGRTQFPSGPPRLLRSPRHLHAMWTDTATREPRPFTRSYPLVQIQTKWDFYNNRVTHVTLRPRPPSDPR